MNELNRLASCLERGLLHFSLTRVMDRAQKRTLSIFNRLLLKRMGISLKKQIRKNVCLPSFGYVWVNLQSSPASSSSHTASTQRILYFLPALLTCTMTPLDGSISFNFWVTNDRCVWGWVEKFCHSWYEMLIFQY